MHSVDGQQSLYFSPLLQSFGGYPNLIMVKQFFCFVLLYISDSHKHKDKYKEHKHKDHKKDKEREKSKHGNGYGVCFHTLHRCTFLHVGVCAVVTTYHPFSAVFLL